MSLIKDKNEKQKRSLRRALIRMRRQQQESADQGANQRLITIATETNMSGVHDNSSGICFSPPAEHLPGNRGAKHELTVSRRKVRILKPERASA